MGSRSSEIETGFGIRGSGFASTVGPSQLGPYTVAIAIAISLPVFAQQADRARTEALARRATERLQALQREADQLASQAHTLLGDLRKLDIDRQMKAVELRQIDAQAQEAAAELESATAQVRELEQRDIDERPGLRARLVEMYKLGQGRYLRLLLSTADLRRVGQASRTVAALAELDRKRIARHQHTLGELKATRSRLETRHQQIEKLRADAGRAQAAADRAAQARSDLIRDIDRRRDLNAQLTGELQAAQQKLQLALRDLAAGASVEAPTLPLGPFRGDLPWPIEGAGRRRVGRPAGAPGTTSNGIMIGASEGAAVQAILDGTVAFADTFGGFGNLVIVDHGARAFSLYGHLFDIAVKRGAQIERGQTIGASGSPPAGPAGLYFELRIDGQPVDPLQWLKKK